MLGLSGYSVLHIKWVLIESFFFTAFDLGGADFDDGFNRNWFGNFLGIKKLDQTTIETLSEILQYHNKGKLFLQIKHISLFHLIFFVFDWLPMGPFKNYVNMILSIFYHSPTLSKQTYK